jgi:hypothetical protein
MGSPILLWRTTSSLIVRDFKEMDRRPIVASMRFRTIQICPKDLVLNWRHS